MKLLNTRTVQLEDFLDGSIPPYAILSHRWQKAELSFRDLKPKFADSLPSKPGYAKVYHFCQTALRDGFDYGWVDTACIDKRSSAELSEAINSMFQWYQNAITCYVYMDTVPSSKRPREIDHEQFQAFRRSEWFNRGWTLQELLAPEHVVFLDCNWIKFGTKDSLAREISEITQIEERFLIDNSRLTLGGYLAAPPCVATKMSWASRRTTSRKEDMAYCLLGLFDINMPLLYGEGEKAFARLQEEIIRKTDDETIFAWRGGGKSFLAPSPRSFANCQSLQLLHIDDRFDRPPYNITNRGLEFECELVEQKREVAARRTDDMRHHKLLPLRVCFMQAGQEVVCALAVVEDSPFRPGFSTMQTKRLQRADPDAIYECYRMGRDQSSAIAKITRAAIPQEPTEDRPHVILDGSSPRRGVTKDYILPAAAGSERLAKPISQLFYLSLNEPLDLYGMFRVSKGRTAVSVVGSERTYLPRRGEASKADSSRVTAPIRAQSTHLADSLHERRPRRFSERIYLDSTPKELRAKSEGTEDEYGRFGRLEPADGLILRPPDGRRDRRPYG